MIDTDRITGAAKELGGKIQSAVGDLTGSHRDSAEGRFREAQGAAENVYGQAKETARHAAGSARDVADRAQDYAGQAAGKARDVADRTQDYADRAAGRARDFADEAQDYAEDAYERGSRSLRHGARQVSHQVAEYPLASLVIAGMVGFGLGLLVNANRD